LYRDYSVEADADNEVLARIERALVASDWTVTDGITDNVVATEPRAFRSWGLYSVEIELEVVPMAGNHVRVFVNPYRHFYQGTRRKVPYLRKSWARSALKDLSDALESEGLAYEGTAMERAQEAGVR
jgi:hypothetical protein